MKKVILLLSLLLIMGLSHTAMASKDKILSELQSTISYLQKQGCEVTKETHYITLQCPPEVGGQQPQLYISKVCQGKKGFSLRIPFLFGLRSCSEVDSFEIGNSLNPYAWCLSDSEQVVYSYVVPSPGNIHVLYGSAVIAEEESGRRVTPIHTYRANLVDYENGVTRVTYNQGTYLLCGKYPLCKSTLLTKGKEYSLYLMPLDTACLSTPELQLAFWQVLAMSERATKFNFQLEGEVLTVQTAMLEITTDPELHLIVRKFPISIETFRSASQSLQKEMALSHSKSTSKSGTSKTSSGVKAGDTGSVGASTETSKTFNLQQVLQQKQAKTKSLNFGESVKADLIPRFILWAARNVYPYNSISIPNLAEYAGITYEETTIVATALLLADLYYNDYDSLDKLVKAYLALEVL